MSAYSISWSVSLAVRWPGAQRAAPQSVPVAVNARMGLNEWEMPFFLRNADVITGTGVGSIRVALLWQQVEPQPDVYTWDKLDRVVGQARAHNLHVLVTLRALSSWGTQLPFDAAHRYEGA